MQSIRFSEGSQNAVSSDSGFVGSDTNNECSGGFAFVGAGANNLARDPGSFVGAWGAGWFRLYNASSSDEDSVTLAAIKALHAQNEIMRMIT